MEIRNPDYLVEIARQRGISRAAEQLFVTQSTLSQYLLKLEAEVGTPLFLRDQGKLTLTDAGRICVAAAEDILRIERTAEASVAALQSRGQIDLGVTSAWGMALVADLLPEFRRAYPYVTLRITENRSYRQIKAALRAGRVDLAVMAVTPDDDVPAQGYVHLRQEEIVLVLPADHPFCREQAGDTVPRSVLSCALREVPFLLSCRDSSIRRLEEAVFTQLVFRPNVVCELNRDDFTQKMVANGVGAAIVPAADIRGFSTVRAFRFDPPLCREDILVFRRNVERTEAMTCLEQILVEHSRSDRQVEFLSEPEG